jgi:hypothetical protein
MVEPSYQQGRRIADMAGLAGESRRNAAKVRQILDLAAILLLKLIDLAEACLLGFTAVH